LRPLDPSSLDFAKGDGLLPAIVQDADTRAVLMLGYMNAEALAHTQETGLVTFFSRSKGRLWTKGETSGNVMHVVSIVPDCDADALLVLARPVGPVCHTGADTCFDEPNTPNALILQQLEAVLWDRKHNPQPGSHTSEMFAKGTAKIAQKVGEEAVEVVIEAMRSEPELFRNEAADLLYRLLTLLVAKDVPLADILTVLHSRRK